MLIMAEPFLHLYRKSWRRFLFNRLFFQVKSLMERQTRLSAPVRVGAAIDGIDGVGKGIDGF